MMRIQFRRIAIIAFLLSSVLVYTFYSKSETVTWRYPQTNNPAPAPASSHEQDGLKKPALSPTTPKSPPTDSDTESDDASEISLFEDAKPIQTTPTSQVPHATSIATPSPPPITCPSYEKLQQMKQAPLSGGQRKFPYSRPAPECRTFNLPSLEKLIEQMKGIIRDPDLFRLFENSYPNTLDTTIKWRGYATEIDPVTKNETVTDQELAFVITGDIDAMWLRDSASQIYSYLPLLEASDNRDSLASLWRGVINLHARYILISPYCHSFQPPPESRLERPTNGAYHQNHPVPPYNPEKVFDCKWELDSLASFLQISSAYYQRTKDLAFFQKYQWINAVKAAVDAAGAMRLGTYSKEGKIEHSAWTFTGWTNRGTETLSNDGIGNPTKQNGMVRSAFRPSDDACIYQLLVPANMMWAKYLEEASLIMGKLEGEKAKNLTSEMLDFALSIRTAIDRDAVVHHREFGDIWAYEIDGYGGVNLMDDANVPSLLSMPLFDYDNSSFPLPKSEPPIDHTKIYNNTRNFVLSPSNPYFMQGPVLSAVGGPHIGPGKPWPMAAIVRAITAFEKGEALGKSRKEIEEEVVGQVMSILDSTDGTGVIHESVNAWRESDWSRAWFGWANGLFGELVLRMMKEDEKGGKGGAGLLGRSWQVEGLE
ncbi:hypothetical protein ACMFMG_004804 [Clarireedia jacksonii]